MKTNQKNGEKIMKRDISKLSQGVFKHLGQQASVGAIKELMEKKVTPLANLLITYTPEDQLERDLQHIILTMAARWQYGRNFHLSEAQKHYLTGKVLEAEALMRKIRKDKKVVKPKKKAKAAKKK